MLPGRSEPQLPRMGLREVARVVVQPNFAIRSPFLPADPLLIVFEDGSVLRRSERPGRPAPLLVPYLLGRLPSAQRAELTRIRVAQPPPDLSAGPPMRDALVAPHRPRTTLRLGPPEAPGAGEWVVDPDQPAAPWSPADNRARTPAAAVAVLRAWTDAVARTGRPWRPASVRVAAARVEPTSAAVPWPLPGELSAATREPVLVEAPDIGARLEPLSAGARVTTADGCFVVVVRHDLGDEGTGGG